MTMTAIAALAIACSGTEGGSTGGSGGSGGGGGGGGGGGSGGTVDHDYATLTWEDGDIEVHDSDHRPGYQSRLLRAGDGTLYAIYLKYMGNLLVEPGFEGCDIAIFASGPPAPVSQYHVKVGVRSPGETDWVVETVPLENVGVAENRPFVGSLYGVDAALAGDDLVLAFAAGGPGTATCASSDLVIATRTPAGVWSFDPPVVRSNACCSVAECGPSSACTSGSDVGAWASIAVDDAGGLSVAYVDYHFYWDQDGQTHQGYELWQPAGVRGIRPWSGLGAFGALRWVDGVLTSVFTAFNGGGLYVLRLTGTEGVKADWSERDLFPGWQVGERVSLAVSPDGTVGIAAHLRADDAGTELHDLVYCYSADEGVTWSVPCENVDARVQNLGHNPSLTYDPSGRAVISYYFCGSESTCSANEDGLRLAWRAGPGDWRTTTVHGEANNRSGTYSGVVIDPDTYEPTVIFQDITRNAVSVRQGRFP